MDWVKLKQTQDELQELIDEVRHRVIRLPSGKKSALLHGSGRRWNSPFPKR